MWYLVALLAFVSVFCFTGGYITGFNVAERERLRRKWDDWRN
jgi:hypothetical protein